MTDKQKTDNSQLTTKKQLNYEKTTFTFIAP